MTERQSHSELLLLPATVGMPALIATFLTDYPTFELWLEGTLGKEVWQRITRNRHAVDVISSAAYFDTLEDIHQKALIWLWQRWQADPNYYNLIHRATEFSQAAGILTKTAVLRARCMYAKRRKEKREQQTDLLYLDGNERFIPFHDRPVIRADKRADIARAIETVVQRMRADLTIPRTGVHANGQTNKQFDRIPIEHITRTIIEGYMYHYTDRYSQTGTFRKFCAAKGVSKNQIARWRPQIIAYLREELAAYAPTPQATHQAIELDAPAQKPLPPSESVLQYSLFSADLVDNRTRTQKQADKQRQQPQQTEMFHAPEIAHFGVNAHPLLPLSPHMLLPMMREDPRTEEEIEAEMMKAALDLTAPLFTHMPTATNDDKAHYSGGEETAIFERTAHIEQTSQNPKWLAYLQVVEAAKEVLFWGTTDGVIVTGVAVNLALSVLAAHAVGLTHAEIKAAVQIGEGRGLPPKQLTHPPIPKEQRPHYWQAVEAEAQHYWVKQFG